MIKPRILIVDDDPDILAPLGQYLRSRMNCDVLTRDNGQSAMEVINSEEIHVLLQDLHMPGIDGYTVLRRAQRSQPNIISVVITKLYNAGDIKRLEDRDTVYLAKPFSLKTVQIVLERKFEDKGGFDYKSPSH